MKYILNNPTEEQINALKQLGLCVYRTSEGIHYVDVPEITEEELPKVDVVDLGLPSGLKWASCNIGANKPCDSGLLFQWGRVDGYAYGDNNHNVSADSVPTTTSGKNYAKGAVLDPADDAAYAATNGKLRMPTVAEIDELLSSTNNTWCQCNSVLGMLFTSKKDESKKIFIPVAGGLDGNDGKFYNAYSNGSVWSSSISFGRADYAYCLDFYSGYCNRYSYSRCDGYSVRGVCK